MRILKWFLLNFTIYGLGWLWIVEGSEIAGNLTHFIMGLVVVKSLVLLFCLPKVVENLRKKGDRAVPISLTLTLGAIYMFALAGFSHYVMATIWAVNMLLTYTAIEEAKKEKP